MGKKEIMKLNEPQLRKIVKESVKSVLGESAVLALNYNDAPTIPPKYGRIDEMARINVNEPQNAIFPYKNFDVHIWSNDHEPAHFHIITIDWDVEFYIATGGLYKVKKRGKDKKVLKYMTDKVPEWLSNPCAALPTITNQQNANLQWVQLHPPKP
ncbi:MAG: hypothetical protein IKN22_06645 [Bacteroidaceae bacterium]|nr:hypothetical protein [Bacteroidaceae bacterium]MBR4649062.1 hypothetical protein [Bacteroidaceae bacterium]